MLNAFFISSCLCTEVKILTGKRSRWSERDLREFGLRAPGIPVCLKQWTFDSTLSFLPLLQELRDHFLFQFIWLIQFSGWFIAQWGTDWIKLVTKLFSFFQSGNKSYVWTHRAAILEGFGTQNWLCLLPNLRQCFLLINFKYSFGFHMYTSHWK